MDYAMSVIIGRALPDVRDGLKPAHRRVLYGMRAMGLASNRGYRKCAKIVGEVMGNYHPHGDASIYDTLVRMAQDFNMRYVLVDGQGNFGSIDGDPPAAMRYTEARPEAIAEALMADLDKETVDFVPNYDETTEEPTVLPAAYPEPPRQRIVGHRRRHGDQHPAAQHARGDRRRHRRDRASRRQPKEARFRALMKTIPGPDFPIRRVHRRARGDLQRLQDRPRRDHASGQGDDRREQERRSRLDRRDGDSLSGQQSAPDREDRRAGAREGRSRASPICGTSRTATACGS